MSIANFEREIRDLIWFADERDWGALHGAPSMQSRHQAEIEARAKMARHRPFSLRDGRGTIVKGTDLWCGCTVHRSGASSSHGSGAAPAEDRGGVNMGELHDIRDERPIRAALARADDAATWAIADVWPSAAPPSHLLQLRFREPLTPELAMFDVAATRVYSTLKMKGSGKKLDRERLVLAVEAARTKQERGPGSMAPWTQTAREAFGDLRAADMLAEVTDLGRRLARPLATARQRYLQREITAECEQLEVLSLGYYRRAHTRLPRKLAA